MRKVLFREYIQPKYKDGSKDPVKGTGCFSEEKEGSFHCWGIDYEELEEGPANYTVAIIELPNGEVVSAFPGNMRFITCT